VGTGADPIEALKTYLANQPELQDIAEEMLDVAHHLLIEEEAEWANVDAELFEERQEAQLRLL
jgi:hypothetical protein